MSIEAFINLKDHKENFYNNPSCRLINPSKPEIGKIAKQLLEKIIPVIKKKTLLKQWKNTESVVNWFKDISDKPRKSFICFDLVNFYPSITEELLIKALKWAEKYVKISDDEKNIIIQAKKSLLFKNGTPWSKRGNSNFDVAQGSYDGAETCDLVGLFMLSELETLEANVGLYRDDGLMESSARPRALENIKKKICAIFKKQNLAITIEANKKEVNFLDVTLNLENDTFRPFTKPNDIPNYVHRMSNHPGNVTKNIPASVNRRLSVLSSNEQMFKTAAPLYQESLNKSGYDFKLEFNPTAEQRQTPKRNRQRKILYFNPPYSSNVKTNIGRKFLKLIDKHFPPENPLSKIFNRNTVKVSYRTTPNLAQTISAHNTKILKKFEDKPVARQCSCPQNKLCPLDGKCLSENIVYQATVKQSDGQTNTYIGLTSPDFKKRLGNHNKSFRHKRYSHDTTLSTHLWNLKEKNINYDLEWKIMARANPFSPVSGVCQLCTREKFLIIFKPEQATLNSRNEINTPCLHKQNQLLAKT